MKKKRCVLLAGIRMGCWFASSVLLENSMTLLVHQHKIVFDQHGINAGLCWISQQGN